MEQQEVKNPENEEFHYRVKNVEICIAGTDYVEYDHKINKELIRRPATSDEIIAFGEA